MTHASLAPARRRLNAGHVFVSLVILLAACTPAESQTSAANLSGLVSDQSGGLLPGVTVTVTNLATGTQQVRVTDPDGRYRAVALQPGRYKIVADLSGFTPQTQEITLIVGAEATINFQLGVGALSEVVNVSGAAPLVEVVRSQPSAAIVGEQIAALPVLERNFVTLAQLLPSAAPDQRPSRFATTKFGGAADQRNSFTTIIDGGDIDDVIQGVPTINMAQDAVQEFKVFRNQFDAQYGNALSAVVTVVSKSGTNNFDGSAYYFGRDDALNAKNSFAKTKPDYQQFRVGGALGGPIIANRTHFFGSYEYNEVNDYKIIALPATNPFATRENGAFPSGRTNHLLSAKVDHQLNSKVSMMVRYAYDNQFVLRSSNPSSDTQQGDDWSRTHSLIAETTAVISNALVNSARFHFLTQNVGTDVHSHDSAIIRPSVTTGQPATWPQQFPREHYWLNDTLFLTKSQHDFKFGGDVGYSTSTYESHANESGQFTFTTDLPFDSNVKTTWPISLVIQSPGNFSFASYQLALYVQDNWRVADRVRLNLGLRYDYDSDLRSEKVYTALLADPVFAGIENFVDADRGNDVNNLQPRLGVTWDVHGNGRLVARAGWGLYITRNRPYFQESDQAGTLTNAVRIEDPEKLKLFPDINAILGGKTPEEVARGGGARSLALLANDYVLPSQQTTTVGVGMQLWKNTSLDIDYVHAKGS
ncbi:MAG: TonB-dependent receptor, partial [Acidobacteria bacterium]|nr:TonB-dependent receptor [Acidobacteriota bacterium]